MLIIPARVIASCFGIAAFVAAVLIGWGIGNSTETILKRASVIMIVCWVVGHVVGGVLQRTVIDHIERYKAEHPIDDEYEADIQTVDGGSTGGSTPTATPQSAPMRLPEATPVPSEPNRQVA